MTFTFLINNIIYKNGKIPLLTSIKTLSVILIRNNTTLKQTKHYDVQLYY